MPRNLDQEGTGPADTARVGLILSEVEDVDVGRIDPPPEIWDRVVAELSADRARSAPDPEERQASIDVPAVIVEYWIDGADAVSDVGQGWADFASANRAPELVDPAPDRTLWSYFDSDEIRELWQLVITRARASQAVVQVPFRCDAPHARRWFDMTITPNADGRVHFLSVQVFEEARSTVPLLDPESERDDAADPVPLCSWCGRGRHGPFWLDIEEVVAAGRLLEQPTLPPISYGICEACRDEMSAELLVPDALDDSTI